MSDVGKKNVVAGMWAKVGGPSQVLRRVFVPATVVLAEDINPHSYLVPILEYMDGKPVPPGMVAVIHRGVHTPDICVGMARLMGAHLTEGDEECEVGREIDLYT